MEIDFFEPGYYYHVFNRGINGQTLFTEEEHYVKFLSLCKKYIPEQAEVLAYCLMPSHFHFLLLMKDLKSPEQGKESLFLSHLFNAYAQWLNKKTDRTGTLFQRPFKRKRITDENYLKQVVYYIHRNPLHHKLARKPDEWLYSSYQAILSPQKTMVNREEVLGWFDDRKNFIDYHRMQFDIDRSLLLDD